MRRCIVHIPCGNPCPQGLRHQERVKTDVPCEVRRRRGESPDQAHVHNFNMLKLLGARQQRLEPDSGGIGVSADGDLVSRAYQRCRFLRRAQAYML